MPHNSYNNIKRYAAFIFMVFTVFSGSSEVFDSDINTFAVSRFVAQNARLSLSRTHIQSSVQNNESLRKYPEAENIQACVSFTILICILNNIIMKNSIWKNALF